MVTEIASMILMGIFSWKAIKFLASVFPQLKNFPEKERIWVLVMLLITLLLIAVMEFHGN